MIKVKVCGITNLADAEKALEYGADFLGFNFYPPSPRCLTVAAALQILERLPKTSGNVALFVNEPRTRVAEVLQQARPLSNGRGFTGLQFHGEEDADYCRGWDRTVIKAFRVRTRDSLRGIEAFPADYFLLDSWSAGYGGSGASFPWEWLENIDKEKIILSGGLTVANVSRAIRAVQPYGVDVCSGVEKRPGLKDHEKLKEFIHAAKSA